MSANARIQELGITLPEVAKPAGAYVPAVQSGNLVFTAGQIPLVEGKLIATGKVGKEISVEEAKSIARVCALNAVAAIKGVVLVSCWSRYLATAEFTLAVPWVLRFCLWMLRLR
jgi:enamine deaminase RidA (YjgF/YER057c/UK114 family)